MEKKYSKYFGAGILLHRNRRARIMSQRKRKVVNLKNKKLKDILDTEIQQEARGGTAGRLQR